MHITIGSHHFPITTLPRTTISAPTDTLIPRHTDVAQVSELLATRHRVCIVGMPGTGKSSLAIHIAGDTNRYGDAVLWHTFGSNVHQRTTDIYTTWLCGLLGCHTLPSDIIPDAVTLYHVLAQFPQRLVICDDVHDELMLADVVAALPPNTPVLVTTRIPSVAQRTGYDIYGLAGLTRSEAVALLAHRLAVPHADVSSWPWVDAIYHAVAGHPLALTLVAQRLTLLDRHPAAWAAFVAGAVADVSQHTLRDFTQHPDVAAGFMPLLAHNYHSLNPLEKQILHGMAVCDPRHGVSVRVLMSMWQLNDIQITAIMDRLSAYLFVIPHAHGWTQHTIMHAYTHMLVQQQQREAYLHAQLSNALIALLEHDHAQRTYTAFAPEYQQSIAVLDHLLTHDIATAVRLVRGLVGYLHECGVYHNAYELAQQLIQHVAHTDDDQLLTHAYNIGAMTALACAIHIGSRRNDYVHQGFMYVQAAQAHNIQPDDTLAASLLMNVGIILIEIASLPEQDVLPLIEAALRNYERAVNAAGLDATLYVTLCQNRANAYLMRAEYQYPQSHADCQMAIDVCTEALQSVPTQYTSHLYIGLYMTQSSAYHLYANLPGVDSKTYLHHAQNAAHEALIHLDETQQPQRYAQVLMNYANLCSELSTQPDEDHRVHATEALTTYEESLRYRTASAAPMDYAWTQHNYADALRITANMIGEPQAAHFHAAWVAIHEALRFRTAHEHPAHHALSHYVRAHIAVEYATAIEHNNAALATTIVAAGLESYDIVVHMQTDHDLPSSLVLGITDYASVLWGLHAWLHPDMGGTAMDRAVMLNTSVRAAYPHNASDDQAEVLIHRLQLHVWAWMLRIATPGVARDIAAAEALVAQPLRLLLTCQLHMQLALAYRDLLPTETRQCIYHSQQAQRLAQRLSYAPADNVGRSILAQLGTRPD